MQRKVIVIGAGIGGLSCAAYLTKAGYNVTILEKNTWVGGRIQTLKTEGFTFDLGPSWYWMPEVFESFYADFGRKTSDFYELKRLNPSYRIYFEDEFIELPTTIEDLCEIFEKHEAGAGKKLRSLLAKTKIIYDVAMKMFLYKIYWSFAEIINIQLFISCLKILAQYNSLQSVHQFLTSQFKNEKLIKILEFPIFFLGASTKEIPAMYSMMNHVDMNLGTWYPVGGFGNVAEAYKTIAEKAGVTILLNEEVKSIAGHSVQTHNKTYNADIIVSNADYHHSEVDLLKKSDQSYPNSYWQTKKLAPSALIMYIGLNKKIKALEHHTLFFHHSWEEHIESLYTKHNWPENPLYYISCASKTDPSVAPENGEAIVILIPVAAGLKDTTSIQDHYFRFIISDLEKKIGEEIFSSIVVKQIYSAQNFIADFHAYEGNAYGLAHTMNQTAVFRPKNRSSKLSHLFYVGQFTNPGIGVPTVSISGKVVAQKIISTYGSSSN